MDARPTRRLISAGFVEVLRAPRRFVFLRRLVRREFRFGGRRLRHGRRAARLQGQVHGARHEARRHDEVPALLRGAAFLDRADAGLRRKQRVFDQRQLLGLRERS